MRKNIFAIFLVISVFALIMAVGCAPSQPPAPTYIPPQTCSLMVVSQSDWVYGTIYVSVMPTGNYLVPWGSQTITNVPCNQNIPVYLVDENGFVSNTRYVFTTPGAVNIVNIDTWP